MPPLSRPSPRARIAIVAWIGHLALPAWLLISVLHAHALGSVRFQIHDRNALIGLLAAVWIAAAIGYLVFSRDRAGFAHRVAGPMLAVYTTYVMLAGAELALHAFPVASEIPGQLPPGHVRFGPPDPDQFPGIHGVINFTINRLGLRGPLPPEDRNVYRIVVVGGSTSICTWLDDSKAWPQVLMDTMNAGPGRPHVWVGNAGVSGKSAMQHLDTLQWLPGILSFDRVIFLIGVNDMYGTISFQGRPTERFMEELEHFQQLPAGVPYRTWQPSFRGLQLFRAGLLLVQRMQNESSKSTPLDLRVPEFREFRARGSVAALPDLSIGLAEYRQRVHKLAARCGQIQVPCLFVTQPSMWRADLTPAESRLLWAGMIGSWDHPLGYVSAADLAKGMDAYNHVLLDVCGEDRLDCLDLAPLIRKNTSAFYDDVHYNEAGARLVAEKIREHLQGEPPFVSSPLQP